MFQTLTNVQSGDAVGLQQGIDNRSGCLRVGLRSITYAVGWYNINAGESFSLKNDTEDVDTTTDIPPGLYGFTQLKDLIEAGNGNVTLEVNKVNGLITLVVGAEWEILLSDGLLFLLGLDDGLGGQWLDAGTYDGDRPVNFATRKMMMVHLEQINTTDNVVDGAPSTLLACVGIGCHSFGDVHTVRVEHLEYKRLRNGSVGELKVMVRDETGKVVDNHNLPISLVLEFKEL